MTRDLIGRHALVCGASMGIGRATAVELAARGARVTALARNAERLDALVSELRESGAESPGALVADYDDRSALARAIEQLVDGAPVQIWVNNTGGPPGGRLHEADPEALESAFARHLLAPQTILRLVLPGMRDAGYGRIVNVLSTSVREPIPNLGVSNTMRAAVAGWAKTLSHELPPGLTINNVLPGFTDTPRLSSLREARARREGVSPEDVLATWKNQVPEGRLARPEETAAMICFLCSAQAGMVRGQSIAVDGGRLKSI